MNDAKRKYKFTNGSELEVGTMYCVGKNYSKHAAEMGDKPSKEPVIFMKPPTAYAQNGDEIYIPDISKLPHHEVELIAVIGKECRNINRKDAVKHIAGYGVGIDLTLRDLQNDAKKKGLPWAIAKGFAQSAPASEIIPAARYGDETPDFELTLEINGEIKQKANTKDMTRRLDELIEYLSKIFILEPGDCVFTGTPEGVGPVKSGDKLIAMLNDEVKIEVSIK